MVVLVPLDLIGHKLLIRQQQVVAVVVGDLMQKLEPTVEREVYMAVVPVDRSPMLAQHQLAHKALLCSPTMAVTLQSPLLAQAQ
jgi:hypothetical protein